jgi:hypothetical protein
MPIELITMVRVIMMGTGISVVRMAAIILMELMMRWEFVIRAGIVMMEAIKLVMSKILIMRVEIVLVHGAMWATMPRRIKAFGLLFIKRILVPVVGESMFMARKFFFIGTWVWKRNGSWRTRGTLPSVMSRRTWRAGRAGIVRRARRRRRRRRRRRGRWRWRWRWGR